MYDVITIGGAVRDFTFYIETERKSKNGFIFLPEGEKININEAYFTHGGGACNVAVGLANFGLKVAAIIRVGQDYSGRAIIDGLKKKKIETKFIQIDPKLHTGVSTVIQPKGGERTILTYRGANDALQLTTNNPAKAGQIANSNWIYVASLSGKNWESLLNKIYDISMKSAFVPLTGTSADKHRIRVVWNPGILQLQAGKKKLAKFLKKTEILILNRNESATLIGKSEKNVTFLLRLLYQLGPKIIVITCGKNGAYLMNKESIIYEPSRSTKVVDTTGAGDSFSAGFLAGLVLFNNLKKALKLGIFNSAANLSQVGAQVGLLTKQDLKKLKFN